MPTASVHELVLMALHMCKFATSGTDRSTWDHADDGERDAEHEHSAEEALPAQQLVGVQVHVAQQQFLQDHLPRRCTWVLHACWPMVSTTNVQRKHD